MKLENYKLGQKLEKLHLENVIWGGATKSNGHVTKTLGDDCDSIKGDSDGPPPDPEEDQPFQ